MLIVAGHLTVAAAQREAYLADCVAVIAQARRAPGCLDFAISADPLEPDRINIFERWRDQADVDAFRGAGPDGSQEAAITAASVAEYDVGMERPLFTA